MLTRNVSGSPQVYYTSLMEPVEIPPKCCIETALLQEGMAGSPHLQECESLESFLNKHPTARVLFVRGGGLGDVLCLTPVLVVLRERYPSARFAVGTSCASIFRDWPEIETVDPRRVHGGYYDIGFMLDGILELDYVPGSYYRGKPRLQIYLDVLGMKKIRDPVFRLTVAPEDRMFARDKLGCTTGNGRKTIGVQVAGNSPMRQLPWDTVKNVIEGIAREGHTGVVLHNEKVPLEGKGIINLSGETTLHQLAAVIHALDLVVTMDSGAMWVAHTTQTPLVAVLGPTRPEDKTCYHLNCRNLETNRWIGCDSCFESTEACGGSVACLRDADAGRILAEVLEAAE